LRDAVVKKISQNCSINCDQSLRPGNV
jgi:hypothetical protein